MNELPVKLTYLTNEWEILEAMAQDKGAKNFRSHVKTSLAHLAKTCPPALDIEYTKKSNNYIIPPNICAKLLAFSQQRKIPLASLVRWYVSDPLLREYYESKRQLVAP